MLYLFIPDEVDIGFMDFMGSDSQLSELIFNVMSYVAMVLVAPFYTMAGFALYISRRITLEGWDIEIRFRHLAERQPSTLAEKPENSSGLVRKVAS